MLNVLRPMVCNFTYDSPTYSIESLGLGVGYCSFSVIVREPVVQRGAES